MNPINNTTDPDDHGFPANSQVKEPAIHDKKRFFASKVPYSTSGRISSR
jgi:hypothetical protein